MIGLYPLILSWLAGAGLLMLDGRRPVVAFAGACVGVAVLILDVAMLYRLTVLGASPVEVVTGYWPLEVGIRLRVDSLSAFFSTISAAVLAAVLVHEWLAGVRYRLFPGLVLLMAAGLHGAFVTGDLFNFYVFFELAVVSSFGLAAYGYGSAEIRGAFIYVAVNLFGSMLFLIGVAGVYQATGTLDLGALQRAAESEERVFLLPSTLIFTALSLKLGLFPVHGWVPVLYRQARPPVVAAMTGALVNLGAYGLLRLGHSAFDAARQDAAVVLLTVGAMAMLYGGWLAAFRREPAELGAYVSVMHAGYVVLALGIGGVAGVLAILLVVLAGSLDKALTFLVLDASGGTRRLAALVAAASVAGLPFTPGFVAKLQLTRAALDAAAAPWSVAAVLGSGVMALAAMFRYWRLVRTAQPDQVRRRNLVVGGLAVVIVAIGLGMEPISRLAARVGSDLLGGAR